MAEMISDLIDKDFAYESDGHVFFDVSKYEEYGQLSGNTLDALRGGDRVGEGEVARKKNAADFVLWKPELNGVGWDAPFGRGRPGWHIECSAMAKETLTKGTQSHTIDIHCGGVDLKFPHHENEIAQSNCAHDGAPLANYWVHNEFLNMGSEKMSKSLGNVTLVHDLLKEWDGEVIRLALLKAHYRSELSWSEDLLKESKAQLDGWYRSISKTGSVARHTLDFKNEDIRSILSRISSSLLDDVSYNRLINQGSDEIKLFDQAFDLFVNGDVSKKMDVHLHETVALKLFSLIGLLQKKPTDWFKGGASSDDQAEFDAIAKRREVARAAKDWAAADAARDEATAKGIVLEDGPEGTTWRKA